LYNNDIEVLYNRVLGPLPSSGANEEGQESKTTGQPRKYKYSIPEELPEEGKISLKVVQNVKQEEKPRIREDNYTDRNS